MPDPDLEIENGREGGGGGGGVGERPSRPLHKGGRSPKVVFDPSAAVWFKNKGPGPFPGYSTGIIGRCK